MTKRGRFEWAEEIVEVTVIMMISALGIAALGMFALKRWVGERIRWLVAFDREPVLPPPSSKAIPSERAGLKEPLIKSFPRESSCCSDSCFLPILGLNQRFLNPSAV